MSKAVERFLTDYQTFAGNGGAAPAWLRELRAGGMERFRTLGLPTTKQEEWRFTSVQSVAERNRGPSVPPRCAPNAETAKNCAGGFLE